MLFSREVIVFDLDYLNVVVTVLGKLVVLIVLDLVDTP
jgi:hypothetical protein